MTDPVPELPPGVSQVLVIPGAEAVPHGFVDLIADQTVRTLSLGGTQIAVNGYRFTRPTAGAVRVVVPAGPVRVVVNLLVPTLSTHLDLFVAPGQVVPVFHRYSWVRSHPGYLSTTPLGSATPEERNMFQFLGLFFAGLLLSSLLTVGVFALIVRALP